THPICFEAAAGGAPASGPKYGASSSSSLRGPIETAGPSAARGVGAGVLPLFAHEAHDPPVAAQAHAAGAARCSDGALLSSLATSWLPWVRCRAVAQACCWAGRKGGGAASPAIRGSAATGPKR